MKKTLFCLLFLIPFMAYAQNENDRITEICGVKFGSSLSSAKSVLDDKFRESGYVVDNEGIVYYHETYGGITFDNITFYFKQNGSNTYLDIVRFTIYCKTKTDADQEKENIVEAIRRKYTLIEEKDSKGNVSYLGGISPLNSRKYGFFIKSGRHGMTGHELFENYPWEVYLQYGSYGYGEEF